MRARMSDHVLWENSTALTQRTARLNARTGIIEGLILYGLTAIGVSGAALNILVPTLTAIAMTGISLGLQALMAPKPPKPEDGKAPKTQSIPPRIYAIGRNRIAGYYMLWESDGDKLYAVQALAGHRINSIDKFWLHDDEVTVDANGYVQEMDDGRYKNDRVQIKHRVGIVPETPYAEVVTALGASGQWTNNHRGDGQASLAMICRAPGAEKFQQIFPHGAPQASAEGDWALMYDWRDPDQDINDPDTWKFSKNCAVALAWHECFNPFGNRRDFSTAILPVLSIWTEEANICDEDVPRASGGTEKRYEVNGWATTEQDPRAAQNAILNACDGWLCERGDGALLFRVGKFREELVETITDEDIIGHFIQNDVPEEDEVNRLVPKFTYPETGYTTTDTDFFEDTAAQVTAGRVLATDVDLTWVHQWRQARRLGLREWRRLQEKRRGSLDLRLSGINAVYSRWIRILSTYRIPRLNNVVIENRRAVLALMKGGFQMEWVQHPNNIDDWDPATDEGAAPPVPPKVYGEGLPTATIDTLTAVSSGGSVTLRVSIVDPIREDLTPQVRYRVKDAGGGTPGAWVTQEFPDAEPARGLIVLDTNAVPPNKVLEVQAGFKATGGTSSDWRPEPPQEITSVADPVAPIALTAFSASGGLGRASIGFSIGNDSHIESVSIYRVPSGAALDKATHKVAEVAANPSFSYAYTDGDATRTNLVVNGTFDADTDWTKSGMTISGGVASKAAGASGNVQQSKTLTSGATYRFQFDGTLTAGSGWVARLFGTTTVSSATFGTNGTHRGSLIANASSNAVGLVAGSSTAGTVDNFILYQETASCAPQGVWDYYAIPENVSGIEGPVSGPVTVTIV